MTTQEWRWEICKLESDGWVVLLPFESSDTHMAWFLSDDAAKGRYDRGHGWALPPETSPEQIQSLIEAFEGDDPEALIPLFPLLMHSHIINDLEKRFEETDHDR